MEIDKDKIDEAVLALLYLTSCDEKVRAASWKGYDWDALNRLHEKGLIEAPVNKNKSVGVTESGRAKSKELFFRLFGKAE